MRSDAIGVDTVFGSSVTAVRNMASMIITSVSRLEALWYMQQNISLWRQYQRLGHDKRENYAYAGYPEIGTSKAKRKSKKSYEIKMQ